MFREDDPKFEAILENKMAIAAIEADLDEHLLEIRKMLKHSKLVYVTVAGIEASILPTVRSGTNWQYLVELRNTDVARVPKNWVKMSGTKTVSRFHSPQITKFLQEREQQKESLAVECDRAYSAFLRYHLDANIADNVKARYLRNTSFSGMSCRILGFSIVCYLWRRLRRYLAIRSPSLWMMGGLK